MEDEITTSMGEGNSQEQEKMKMPDALRFGHICSKVKHLDRAGWVRCGIPKPETVGSHMYRMATMSAFLFEEIEGLDLNKCIKMSLAHDIGESIIGDITPNDGVSSEVKFKIEMDAVNKISNLLPATKSEELRKLFLEYEEMKTPESKFVHGIDKYDMVLQAYEYEQQEGKPGLLQQFFDSTKVFFADCHPAVKDLVEKLYVARDANIPFPRVV